MDDGKKNWGGSRPNAGRKSMPEKRRYEIRLTISQIEKLKKLGGSKWVAQKIDEAEE